MIVPSIVHQNVVIGTSLSRLCHSEHNHAVDMILVTDYFVQGQRCCILLRQLLSWLKSANNRLRVGTSWFQKFVRKVR